MYNHRVNISIIRRARGQKVLLTLGVFFALSLFITPFVGYGASPNLIPNPSLETASSNPQLPQSWQKGGSGSNTRVLTYPVAGYDGQRGAKAEITSYTSGDAKWYFQEVPVTPGATYTFKNRYQSSTVSYVTLRYTLSDGTFKYPDLQRDLPAQGTWTQFEKTFTVPTTYNAPVVSVTVFHLIKSVGSITVDDFSLTQLDTISPSVTLQGLASPVSGNVILTADATDNDTVAFVQFYIDAIPVGVPVSVAPYTTTIDTTSLTNGTHILTAEAFDTAGNRGMSTSISFSVENVVVVPTGTITVVNLIINDNGATKTLEDFPLFVDNANVASGVATTVSLGTHIVSEITDPNYTRTFSGDCDQEGVVVVAENQNKTCIITNDDIAAVPPITSPNLIPNPSLETASSNPQLPQSWQKGGSGSNTRVLTYPVAGYDGQRGAKAEITSYTSGDAKWYFAHIPASSGQQYVFSDFYKSTTTSYITIQYQLADGTYKYQDIATNISASTQWTQISRGFTVPTYASPVVSMTVFHLIKSIGSITVDNYILQQFVPPSPSDPTNLIQNPSVEYASVAVSDMPYGWSRSVSSGSTATFMYGAPASHGTKSLGITISNYTSGAGARWYFQQIPVQGGQEYRFSDTFKSTTTSYVTVQFLMANGTYQYMDLMRLAPSENWKTIEYTFLVPQNAVSLIVLHSIKSTGTLYTDNYSLRALSGGAFGRGMVTLAFDDGLATVFNNAIPILNAHNIKSSQYIITHNFNEQPYYVTVAQMLSMNADGHEIGSHTQNHVHLTQIPPATAWTEISQSKQELASLGATPNTIFVYPYGEYNDVIRQMVIDAGYSGARTVHTGYNTRNSDRYSLRDQHVEANTSFAQVKSYIDTARATNTWVILEFHSTDYTGDQYSNTPELISEVAEYLSENAIPVVTIAEGVAMMN